MDIKKLNEELELILNENGIKSEPEPIMTEYTRKKDKVTFKVGDIVTCPSPGEFKIINIFFLGAQVWKGKMFYRDKNPDVGHIAELENIKTKRRTSTSIMYLKK